MSQDYPMYCPRCKKLDFLYDNLCSKCLDEEDDIEALNQILGKEPKRWIPDLIK